MESHAQNHTQATVLELSITEVIALAKSQSLKAITVKNKFQTAQWEYKTYRANLLPEVSLDGNIPVYKRSFSPYQHEDGSYSYVRNNNLTLGMGLNVTQNIPLTGGQIRIGTSLDFTSQLGGGQDEFLSVPIHITLIQPLFTVNTHKWDMLIEPLRYEEAQIIHTEEMEQLTLEVVALYFNFLLARTDVDIAKQNLENANKLYEVGQAKRDKGQLSKNELIQLEIATLQSRASLTEAKSSLRARMFQLNAFLGLNEGIELRLQTPLTTHAGVLSYGVVLEQALKNSSFTKSILRRQKEADYAVANAKGNLRRIDLYASVGLSGVDNSFASSYANLVNNQVVEVGVSLPILDWGKREAQVMVAQSNRAVEESRIREEEINFSQDIFLLVENFNNQAQQLQIAIESDKLAQSRYDIAMETFISGDINMLDLNDARDSRDAASRRLIEEMYRYWNYYYNIQGVTLESVEALLAILN